MRTFKASRLSQGNSWFPPKIMINDFGVTLRIPGLFGGNEKTLPIQQISSVEISTPLIGFSSIVFKTLGMDKIVAEGFSKSDAKEIKSLVHQLMNGDTISYDDQPSSGYSENQQRQLDELNNQIELARLEKERLRRELAEEKSRIGQLKVEKQSSEPRKEAKTAKDFDDLTSDLEDIYHNFLTGNFKKKY